MNFYEIHLVFLAMILFTAAISKLNNPRLLSLHWVDMWTHVTNAGSRVSLTIPVVITIVRTRR